MTLHFFPFSNKTAPSSRQRAYYVAEELSARGISVAVHQPPVLLLSTTQWPRKFMLIVHTIRSLFSIRKGDIIFLQRAISNKYFFVIMVAYLFSFRRKMIFDFDDPIYLHDFLKTKVFTKMADAVIVCTHGQAEWARRYNDKVEIFHNMLTFDAYQKYTKDYSAAAGRPVIGWLGTGPEHLANLPILVPVLRRLAAQELPFTFVLIGAFKNSKVYGLFQHIPNLDVQFIDRLEYTNLESAPREIQKFDIGVVPHQSEGEWNRSKTSMKMLEYMACAVPAVVSAFGEMPYIIKDGVNGYLASSEDEWVEKLQKLLVDKELRTRLGRAGQETVQENYSYDTMIPRMMDLIASVSAEGSKKN